METSINNLSRHSKRYGITMGSIMKPAAQAHMAGLESLQQVSNATGVSRQTLCNWAMHKPQLFKIVLSGVKSHKEAQK